MTQEELKRTYIISDTHFAHSNIIKYCYRPFWKGGEPDTAAQDEYILRQIDELPRNSILIHLGDVGMMPFADLDYIKQCVTRMAAKNRKLILVMGNHDSMKKSQMHKKWFGKEVALYKSLGFDVVYQHPIYFNDLDVVISHAPVSLLPSSTVCNIHGHTHNKPYECPEEMRYRYFNASCDVIGYKPILFTEVLASLGINHWEEKAFIKEKPIDVETLIKE